jgi:hypothetical protein
VNGYIEAGYSVVLGSLGVYAAVLLRREHAARARLGPAPAPPAPAVPPATGDAAGQPPQVDAVGEPGAAR